MQVLSSWITDDLSWDMSCWEAVCAVCVCVCVCVFSNMCLWFLGVCLFVCETVFSAPTQWLVPPGRRRRAIAQEKIAESQ